MDLTPRSSRGSASPSHRRRNQEHRTGRSSYATPTSSHQQSVSPLAESTAEHGLGLSYCDLPVSQSLVMPPTMTLRSMHPSNYWTDGTSNEQASSLPVSTMEYFAPAYSTSMAVRTSDPSYELPLLTTSGSIAASTYGSRTQNYTTSMSSGPAYPPGYETSGLPRQTSSDLVLPEYLREYNPSFWLSGPDTPSASGM
jgi:hypothetical protein